MSDIKEGNLKAPQRQPIDWQCEPFYDQASLYAELERVFGICHGCRRCVSLCDSFPTLFDLIDESTTLEIDGVDKNDYMKVVDQCYLCDLCAETKCPYLPPHEWQVDFPHLMLRAKAYKFKHQGSRWRDRIITTTDSVFKALSLPGVAQTINAAAHNSGLRKLADKTVGIHAAAPLPRFHSRGLSKRIPHQIGDNLATTASLGTAVRATTGKVAIYVTCYGEHNEPEVVEDLAAVLNHNDIAVKILQDAYCCGMPKLELGDLDKVSQMKDRNLPVFLNAISEGYDILAPIPSCVLMYKQELPLMFPGEENVKRIKDAFFDPFEYLMLRYKAGLIRTNFRQPLGRVAYHVACHQRVQNIGMKTREFLALIPGTEVTAIERCSGHDGTYAIKSETYDKAMKIARPVVNRIKQVEAETYGSDCPMAGRMLQHGLDDGSTPSHPISLVRRAYGLGENTTFGG